MAHHSTNGLINDFTTKLIPHVLVFFFHDTTTTEIYTLSLHDALPIYERGERAAGRHPHVPIHGHRGLDQASGRARQDRKSTRLNSSHTVTSYAVFCLKKKRIAATYPPRPAPMSMQS